MRINIGNINTHNDFLYFGSLDLYGLGLWDYKSVGPCNGYIDIPDQDVGVYLYETAIRTLIGDLVMIGYHITIEK